MVCDVYARSFWAVRKRPIGPSTRAPITRAFGAPAHQRDCRLERDCRLGVGTVGGVVSDPTPGSLSMVAERLRVRVSLRTVLRAIRVGTAHENDKSQFLREHESEFYFGNATLVRKWTQRQFAQTRSQYRLAATVAQPSPRGPPPFWLSNSPPALSNAH